LEEGCDDRISQGPLVRRCKGGGGKLKRGGSKYTDLLAEKGRRKYPISGNKRCALRTAKGVP